MTSCAKKIQHGRPIVALRSLLSDMEARMKGLFQAGVSFVSRSYNIPTRSFQKENFPSYKVVVNLFCNETN